LLFLKRATVPVIERTATGVAGKEGEPAPAAAGGASPAGGVHVEKLEDGNFAVTFRLKLGASGRVTVAGSFNDWDKDATPCASAAEGIYEATVRVKGGRISYKFVVNGSDWRTDPANAECEDDGHGGKNSVVNVN
jgi:1,4-alpha-glucan branching enzyme